MFAYFPYTGRILSRPLRHLDWSLKMCESERTHTRPELRRELKEEGRTSDDCRHTTHTAWPAAKQTGINWVVNLSYVRFTFKLTQQNMLQTYAEKLKVCHSHSYFHNKILSFCMTTYFLVHCRTGNGDGEYADNVMNQWFFKIGIFAKMPWNSTFIFWISS